MSPWLLKRFSRKTLFFSELLAVSTIIHAVVGLALFVLYRGQYESFSFEVHSKFNSDQPVLFLHHRGSRHSTHAAAFRKTHTRCVKSTGGSKHVHTRSGKNAVVAQASKAKKIVEKTATMFLDKTKKPKAVSSKKSKKQKAQQLKVAAKELPIPEVVEKPVLQESQTIQKVSAQETVPENVLKETAAASSKEELKNEEVAGIQESSVPESFDIAIGSESADGGEGEEQEFPGLSPEAARVYYAVQEEITTRWKPPLGLPKDLVCTVSVRLDHEGAIANATVKKSSGVLIYDLAASQAAQEMKLPQIAWGKEFSIAFKL